MSRRQSLDNFADFVQIYAELPRDSNCFLPFLPGDDIYGPMTRRVQLPDHNMIRPGEASRPGPVIVMHGTRRRIGLSGVAGSDSFGKSS